WHRVSAMYLPDDSVTTIGAGVSPTRTLVVKKAKTKVSVKAVRKSVKKGKAVALRITVKPTAIASGGAVVVEQGKKIVARATLKKGKATIKVKKLKRGKHKLRVFFQGPANAAKASSKRVTVGVR
uniref:Ig-like domain repeat protein n=1 Tax=Mucilaginibacter ximonensis TaxID=538021 RepID=UPI003670CF27